jgi:hypothetical protein
MSHDTLSAPPVVSAPLTVEDRNATAIVGRHTGLAEQLRLRSWPRRRRCSQDLRHQSGGSTR